MSSVERTASILKYAQLGLKIQPIHWMESNHSVPLFEKEGLGEILLDKSSSIPLFQRGR